MMYALVIMTPAEEAEVPTEAERDFEALAHWWADLRAQGKIVASARLAPARTATIVSWHVQAPIVTDGPYVEAKETVGGFVLLDVDSEAEALQIARSLVARRGTRVEVRRVVESPLAER